jgi:hypothetical protein
MTCFMSRHPLDFQELLAAQGDVLGLHLRVRRA